jgi:CBS domain-containing protein
MKKNAIASDVMNPDVMTVTDDMSVPELAAFLTENQITGAPVLDTHGHAVGVVSVTDIAESGGGAGSWQQEDGVQPEDRRGLHVENTGQRVRDIMTPTVYTVPDDTPVSQLASTMIAGRVHRLLVTKDKRIVGIVTALDLLKLLV